MMKKSSIITTITLATALMASCTSQPDSVSQDEPVIVEVASVLHNNSNSLSVSGTLSAKSKAEISTRIMAYVDRIYVKPGDNVKTGQILLQLSAEELLAKKAQAKAQIAEAELATNNARRDFKRYQKLHAQESASDKELENMKLNKISMETRLQMAQQGLKEIEAMLAYTQIKAPFSGTVTQKFIDEGSMAKPGMPLLYVEQNHDMEVSANIPENYISQVKVGDKVIVDVKSQNLQLTGTISELSPSASAGGQYAMKISLEDANDPTLRTGMFVAVRIPVAHEAKVENGHLLVNQQSLIHREQLTGVYVVNSDQRAVLRWLRLGKKHGEQVEVISGLIGNEQIIVDAKGKLYNGRKVKVK